MDSNTTKTKKHREGIDHDKNWIRGLLDTAALRSFYGEISIRYENGRILKVEENRTLKPPREKT